MLWTGGIISRIRQHRKRDSPMPELPEIETYVRALRPKLIGRAFTGVHVLWGRTINRPSRVAFKRKIPGLRIFALHRRAKYFVFELGTSSPPPTHYLLVHLKMTGQLDVVPRKRTIDNHDHVIFDLDDGRQLRFNDTRKFGRMYLVADPEEVTGPLGPEPLEQSFTLSAFKRLLAARSGRLKPLLLDQTFIAGLGNIYADEALWRARLHPLRRADSLTEEEIRMLYRGIRKALRDGIQHNGASFDWVYRSGAYELRVYDREGQPCSRCGRPIRRIVVGQRSAHYCARCQSLNG